MAATTPVWLVLVLGLAGILGTLLSPMLSERVRRADEDNHWRRSELLSSCAGVTKAVATLTRAANSYWSYSNPAVTSGAMPPPRDEELDRRRHAFDAALADLNYAVGRVGFLADVQVHRAALAILDFANDNLEPSADVTDPDIAPFDPLGNLRELHEAFHIAAQRDLKRG